MNGRTRNLNQGNLEKIVQVDESPKKKLGKRIEDFFVNYLIDTGAKVAVYTPIMGAMEAYNGLDSEQIVGARMTSALIDVAVAKTYIKTADWLYKKLKVDKKEGGFKAWLIDTLAMVGVYSPAYAGVLAANGADAEKIGSALVMGAGIAALTSRPFRKYFLFPMREKLSYRK